MDGVERCSAVGGWHKNAHKQCQRASDAENVSRNVFIAAPFERKDKIERKTDAYQKACYAEAERIIKSRHTDGI